MAAYHYVFIRPTQIEGIHYAVGSPADGFSDGTMESLIRACRITVGEGGGEKLKKAPKKKPAKPKPVEVVEDVSTETDEETGDQVDVETDASGDQSSDDEATGDDAAGGAAEEGTDESDEESDEEATEADDDALTLKQLGVGKKFLEGFASAKVTTLGEAREYFAKHGSFEKLPNIGEVSSRDLIAQLGL